MIATRILTVVLVLVFTVGLSDSALARKKSRRKRYSGPPPTHPVVLWSRTLSESTDREQRKVAAFKLSQYSQTIYQQHAIDAIIKCTKDSDVQIKVFCTKAMGQAGTKSHADNIRKVLLDLYKNDPQLRNTVVRAFIVRKDDENSVHDTFLDSLKKTTDIEELTVLVSYFELFGSGNTKFVDALSELYKKNDNLKLHRAVAKAISERAQGQDHAIELLATCVDSKDTPLVLTCLSGLQLQAKKDARAWTAVEKAIESNDTDVLVSTLDVINALPETTNIKVANRLVEILEENEDTDIQERAALALGVCGDKTQSIVKSLTKRLEDKESEEAVRIASALVLGKQAVSFPDKPKELLSKCSLNEESQALKTACQLGLQDLESRTKAAESAAKAAPPVTEPAKTDAKSASTTDTSITQ